MRSGRPARPITAALAAIAAVGLLAACGQEDATGDGAGAGAGGTTPDQTSTPETATPEPEESSTTAPVPPSAGDVPQSVVDESVALLAEQLGVRPATIEVASATEVTWRDSSMGCAKKDMAYLQALVPGVRVELVAAGTTYAFHQGEKGVPFYCARPTDPTEPVTQS